MRCVQCAGKARICPHVTVMGSWSPLVGMVMVRARENYLCRTFEQCPFISSGLAMSWRDQPVVDSVWQLSADSWCMVAGLHGAWWRVVSVCGDAVWTLHTLCLQPDFLLQWLELVTIQSWAPFRAETRQKRRDLQKVPGKVTFDSWCLVYSVQLDSCRSTIS